MSPTRPTTQLKGYVNDLTYPRVVKIAIGSKKLHRFKNFFRGHFLDPKMFICARLEPDIKMFVCARFRVFIF